MTYFAGEAWDHCHCGRQKKAVFPTCWNCKQEALVQDAHMEGWRRGWDAGVQAVLDQFKQHPPTPRLHPELLKRLIFLCHPDKHGGSQSATEVLQWLLAQRDS